MPIGYTLTCCSNFRGHFSRPGRTLKQVDAGFDDRPLHGGIVRPAAGIAEREIREQESRCPATLDDIDGGTQDHGRNAGGFEMAGDQTHGLVTDGSQGYEKNRIHSVFPASPQNLRCVHLVRAALTVLRRHAVEARREFADSAGCDQLR